MSRVMGALRAEYTKVTTTRMWWVLALVLFAYVGVSAAGISFVFGFQAEDMGVPLGSLPPLVYSFASSVGYVFPLLIGALSVTNEFRHQTLTPTFLAGPRRGTVLSGKLVTAFTFGALYGAVGLLASGGIGALVLSLFGIDPMFGDSDTWALLARVLLAMALWGAVGVGVGVLIPSQVGSIVTILAFTQFLEPILRVAASFVREIGNVAQFLPGAASDSLVGSSFFAIGPATAAATLEEWQGALVLGAYAAVLTALGFVVSWRRDVT
jgi:ABC-2 type transport system permease protein